MDDQMHGEKPGFGPVDGSEPSAAGNPGSGQPDPNLPLKRDRKLLRSSKPLPSTTPSEPQDSIPPLVSPSVAPGAAVPIPAPPMEATPAEQLFGLSPQEPVPAVIPAVSAGDDEPIVDTVLVDTPLVDTPRVDTPRVDTPLVDTPLAPERKFGFGRKKLASHPDSELGVDDQVGVTEAPAPVTVPATAVSQSPAPTPAPTQVLAQPQVSVQPQFSVQPQVSAQPQFSARPPQSAPSFGSGQTYPPGPARLGSLVPTPQKEHPALARLDLAALVAAVVLPPVGLALAIVAMVKGKRLRGWASDLARTAIGVSLVMALVFAVVGGSVWFNEAEKATQLAQVKADQRARALTVKASAPFCDVLAAHPTIFGTEDPDYGWPTLDAPEGYIAAINNYAGVWAQLAEVAPAGIVEETTAVSHRVAGVVQIASALGNSNRAGDLLGLHEKSDVASVEAWYLDYCTPVK